MTNHPTCKSTNKRLESMIGALEAALSVAVSALKTQEHVQRKQAELIRARHKVGKVDASIVAINLDSNAFACKMALELIEIRKEGK